jgi:Uma2 family endonuclease
VYADALVICEKPIYFENRKDTIINPLIVVEVASPTPPEEGRIMIKVQNLNITVV